MIGPGLATWELSAFKTTSLRERLALQFRGEIFKTLNPCKFHTPSLIAFTSSTSARKASGTGRSIDNPDPHAPFATNGVGRGQHLPR